MERFVSDLMNGILSPRVVPIVLALLVITAVALPNGPAAHARDVAGIPVVAYWFAVLSVLRGR
jgi:hypothetical protein